MISDKKTSLKPLLESAEGVHLTGYLVNRGDVTDLKKQLRVIMKEAYEFLHPAMPVEQRKKFLEPLDSLLQDSRIFKKMKGNIGIFRTQDSFRVLNVPVEVEEACVLANTFHVKPLLRWMQADRDFLLLGLEAGSAHLYQGNQHALTRIDSILYPESLRGEESSSDYEGLKRSRRRQAKMSEALLWVHNWIDEVTKQTKPRLFVAGSEPLTKAFFAGLTYRNAMKTPVHPSFSEGKVNEIAELVRRQLKREVSLKLEQALLEFRLAEDMNLSKKNIFQIAKAAVQGRVRKLIVADGIKIFGKLDKKSGGIAIHPFDLDHEDDDLLDDLAQTVLAQGGEVIVASREEIPKGRPVLAILDFENRNEQREDEFEEINFSERKTV